jgi:hypothetical protein
LSAAHSIRRLTMPYLLCVMPEPCRHQPTTSAGPANHRTVDQTSRTLWYETLLAPSRTVDG